MKPNKKVFAREWLILLGLLIVGLVWTPLVFFNDLHYDRPKLPSSRPVRIALELFDIATSKGIAPPDFQTFSRTLNDPKKRKAFYDLAVSKGVPLSDYAIFEKTLAPEPPSPVEDQSLHGTIAVDRFLDHLGSKYYWFGTWLSVLFPYLTVQLVRSVILSIRLIREDRKQA